MTRIRPFRASDRADVAEICLRTGDSGRDATGMHGSDELLADIFVLPYVELEPATSFVVDTGERVSGYVVSAPDTRDFVARYRNEWLPAFAEKYRDLEPSLILELGLNPDRMIIDELDEYPAHLHIDLLPELQGQGMGRVLMRTLLAALHDAGVPGVYLEMSPTNTGAAAFYKKLGFTPLLSDSGDGTRLGIRTDAVV
jgi:ribosomal protein S18 acetylase RimI-like enzyme